MSPNTSTQSTRPRIQETSPAQDCHTAALQNRPVLVVNADDLGLSPEVDEGIHRGITQGIVTAADLMVNPPFSCDLPRFLATGVSLGLHFTLTLGRPCCAPNQIPSLVDPSGDFFTDVSRFLERFAEADLRLELQRQYERFFEMVGRPPEHLSFHKHLHAADPRILALTAEFGRVWKVPVRSLDPTMREFLRAGGTITNDHFLGGVTPAPYWSQERLVEQLQHPLSGITELMCHPGHEMKPIPGVWYLRERESELAGLVSPAVRQAAAAGYELAGFAGAFASIGSAAGTPDNVPETPVAASAPTVSSALDASGALDATGPLDSYDPPGSPGPSTIARPPVAASTAGLRPALGRITNRKPAR